MNDNTLQKKVLYGYMSKDSDELPTSWFYELGMAKKLAKASLKSNYLIIKVTQQYKIVEEGRNDERVRED